MKSFIWKQYTVQITKKNVKNTNVRIKRDNPHVILMSIPYSATYKAGLLARRLRISGIGWIIMNVN